MRILCQFCHWSQPQLVQIAGVLTSHLHCRQGVPGAPQRESCRVFMRATTADDEEPARRRGHWLIVGTAT
jgi:hypothetical protein